MSDRWDLMLGGDLQAPAHARTWVADRIGALPSALVEDALLVVSELVTNAVRHGRPHITLSITLVRRGLRVAVSDGGPALPVLPNDRPGLSRTNGRGLLIVAATVTDWGIDANDPPPGKTVWAELIEV